MYDVQIVFPASERNQVIRKLSPLSVLSITGFHSVHTTPDIGTTFYAE